MEPLVLGERAYAAEAANGVLAGLRVAASFLKTRILVLSEGVLRKQLDTTRAGAIVNRETPLAEFTLLGRGGASAEETLSLRGLEDLLEDEDALRRVGGLIILKHNSKTGALEDGHDT